MRRKRRDRHFLGKVRAKAVQVLTGASYVVLRCILFFARFTTTGIAHPALP